MLYLISGSTFSLLACRCRVSLFLRILLAGLVLFNTSYAQEPFYHQITTKEGLPSNCVYEVRQDHEGFIWVATDNGVARFDGAHFQYFTKDNGLTDNDVFMVRPDKKGRVWFLPSNGEPCFWKDGKIYNPVNTPFLAKLIAETWYNAFGEDAKGNIWFASYRNEIVKLDNTNNVVKYKTDVGNEGQHVFSDVLVDKSGDAWIVNSLGAINLTRDPYKVEISLYLPYGKQERAVYLDGGTILFVFGNEVGIRTRTDSTILKGLDLKDGCVFLHKASNGDVWMANLHDLYWFKGGIINASNQQVLIHQKPIAGIFSDREKNLWVYTSTEGLWIINQPGILHYHQVFTEGAAPYSVFVDEENRAWVGGDHGNLAYLEHNQLVNKQDIRKVSHGGRGRIRSIIQAHNHQLALAFEQGLVLLDVHKLHSILKFGGRSLLKTGDTYWVGASTGAFEISKSTLELLMRQSIFTNRGAAISDGIFMRNHALLPGYRIDDIEADSGGNIWLATPKGLFIKRPCQKAKPFMHRIPLMQGAIRCLKYLNSKTLLIGISGTGLGIVFDGHPRLLRFRSLQGVVINRIARITGKSFWLCTNRGLFLGNQLEDGITFTLRQFTTRDGLLSEQVTDIARHNDNWLIVSEKGLTIFPVSMVEKKSDRVPEVSPASFLVNGKPYNKFTTYLEKETNVRFSYRCLSFKHYGRIRIRYRLHPEDLWKISDSFKQTISNMPRGKYRFEVQAGTLGSPWSCSTYFPEFEVLPPLWQRGWFLFLVLVVSSGSTTALYYFINRYRLEKLTLDQQLTDANLKALRAQIKPHFIFNALNSAQLFVLKNEREKAMEFLGRISQLIRKMLSDSDRQFHSLEEELYMISTYLEVEKQRIRRHFHFTIALEEKLIASQVMIPTMLLQPVVENAIWHGIMNRQDEAGLIEIQVSQTEMAKDKNPGKRQSGGVIQISITDNGPGQKAALRKKTKKGESFGLRSITEKINLLNKRYHSQITFEIQDIVDDEHNPVGTNVSFYIPEHFV